MAMIDDDDDDDDGCNGDDEDICDDDNDEQTNWWSYFVFISTITNAAFFVHGDCQRLLTSVMLLAFRTHLPLFVLDIWWMNRLQVKFTAC